VFEETDREIHYL